MSDILALMIPIIAILCSFGLGAYKTYLKHQGVGLAAGDRQLIESLAATAQRLEQRVITLERALLDAEQTYHRGTEV
jgi:phage shock protein B